MEDLTVFIYTAALCVSILLIWFNTNAFVEYCKVLGLNKLLLGFENNNSTNLSFPQYLYIRSRQFVKCNGCKFLISLITCPLCLSVWLSIFGGCIFLSYIQIPLLFIITFVSYQLIVRIID
jgi:hypothetical protein